VTRIAVAIGLVTMGFGVRFVIGSHIAVDIGF
jgi:hypothetical protein